MRASIRRRTPSIAASTHPVDRSLSELPRHCLLKQDSTISIPISTISVVWSMFLQAYRSVDRRERSFMR
ncbi:MAG: hypothetical protein J7642_13200 [Cyanobacteria bacterium SBC]|nr:hypothetical protein [Cyanobacteria bacterium SBC]